jgi:predicted component of type VI protein secretion system
MHGAATGANGVTMGHAVHYRNAAGEARLEDVPSLSAAVELVERLRNEDGASDVRVFREVPLEVKTYYKVVVAEEAGEAEPAEDSPSVPVASVPRPEPVSHEPPPGAMNLSPPPGSAAAASPVQTLDEELEQPKRSSLFNRG